MMDSQPLGAAGLVSVGDPDPADERPWADMHAGRYPKLRAGGMRRTATFTVLWTEAGSGAGGHWLLAGCVEDSAARERWNLRQGRRWLSEPLSGPDHRQEDAALPTVGSAGAGAVSATVLHRIHQGRTESSAFGSPSADACGFHLGTALQDAVDLERRPLHWSARVDVTPRGHELLIDAYSELSTEDGDGDELALTHDYLCAWVDRSHHRLLEIAAHPGVRGSTCTLNDALRAAEAVAFDELRRPSDTLGRCRHELGLWDALVSAVEMVS